MRRLALGMCLSLSLSGAAALAHQPHATYGPTVAVSEHPEITASNPMPGVRAYQPPDDLLTANGVEVVDGGARRPIAPNMEVAVEPARNLVDPFGERKKPVRLLLRVGRRF